MSIDVRAGGGGGGRGGNFTDKVHIYCLRHKEHGDSKEQPYRYRRLICGEGNVTPLQSSCPENPVDGGARWAAVHGVAQSRTRPSDWPSPFPFHASEKEMGTHRSVPAWRTPGTGVPGGLPSTGSHRFGHDGSD